VSGNVSLYNETPDGPILPTPVVGTVGVLEDRASALRMHWTPGEEIWLLGESTADAAALAGSEHAWRHGLRGGIPTLDLAAAARLIRLLPALARRRTIHAAHDCSTGGMVVALARMAIAAGAGLRADVTAADGSVTAAAFGERAGRVLVGVPAGRAPELVEAAQLAGVAAVRLGVAGGPALEVRIGSTRIEVPVPDLATAWRSGF
jgi:phosphoribosylformylglycinamidine (FGAM) synthase-like enzyme